MSVRRILIAAPLVLGLAGCRGGPPSTPAAAREQDAPAALTEAATTPVVQTEVATAAVLTEPVRMTGNLRSDEVITLSTKATGLVRQVRVREGDRVRKGELLVVVDDADLLAQLDRAQAAVRSADAAVREAEAQAAASESRLKQARISRGIKNAAAVSEHRRAEKALETARTRLSQAKSMSGIVTVEADNRVASARAAVQAARERLKALTEGSRRQERAAAQAGVARAQAQVRRMESALTRREQLLREGAVAAEVVDNARRDHEAAVADLESARQQLSLVAEGPRGEEVRAQEELVRQAEATLRDAEANRSRKQISSEDVDAAENAVQQAEAAESAARANLAQSEWNDDEIGNVEATLRQNRAGVERLRAITRQARADVRLQQELVAQTRIFSPVNGVVTKRSVQVGAAVVQMRNELMTLVSADTIYFEATVPETSLFLVRPGLPARVILDAVPGRIFAGVIRTVIPVADGASRAVRVRISMPRTPAAVVGGFARAEVRGSTSSPTVSIPRGALVSDEGVASVFVVRQGKAVRRPVVTANPGGFGTRLQIRSGIEPGEVVIIEGGASLTDGQSVTVARSKG